jgi:hypothetical protein
VSNLCLSQAEISNDISENQHGLLGVHMVDLRMFADEIKEGFFLLTLISWSVSLHFFSQQLFFNLTTTFFFWDISNKIS